MSLHLPCRRVARSAVGLASAKPGSTLLIQNFQRRTFWKWSQVIEQPGVKPVNPLNERALERKPKRSSNKGALSPSSIFEDEELAGSKSPEDAENAGTQPSERNPWNMASALDPNPESRRRWERKMVIKQIYRRGRQTRAEVLRKQERELLSKSHDFKTSVKKLMPLARQIAGKSIDDAIIQMRFSKKKAAKDVKAHLEHARNEAIVRRGMGLGGAGGDTFDPVKIQTKDGTRLEVKNPTTIYVDQAWCGRGLFRLTPDHRARGKINFMKNRTTSLSVILKEEATRIRLHKEREEKVKNRKVWVQLPNRPITAQRQCYSW